MTADIFYHLHFSPTLYSNTVSDNT